MTPNGLRARTETISRRLRDELRPAGAIRMHPWPVYVAAAVATGSFLGIASGSPLAVADPRPLLIATALGGGLLWVVRLAFSPELRTPLGSILLLVLVARFALAVVIHDASIAIGREGFVTGDDWNYAQLSWGYASWLRGQPQWPYVPPDWNTDVYLFGTYVYLESLVFLLFGRQVLLMEFLNSWAMVVTGVLIFDMGRRLFGQRPAVIGLVLVVIYPSLFLWSVLNLKDALSLLLIALWFWLLLRFYRHPGWWMLGLLFLVLFPMQSLRRYIYLLLLAVLPAGLLVRPGALGGPTRRITVLGALLAILLFATDLNSASWFGRIDLTLFEETREGMGAGARTSFQERTVRVIEGETYVVLAQPSPSPAAQPTPLRTPVPPGPAPTPPERTDPCATVTDRRILNIERSAQLVVVSPSATLPPPRLGTVYVRLCDIVVIGSDATPAPVAARRELIVPREGRILVGRNPVGELGPVLRITSLDSFERTLAYLPTGMTYALFAPFPWSLGRVQDLATVPEMLAWYALLPMALLSLWRSRERWRELLPMVLYVVGLVLAFSLAEGNYGTLFRHRAMLIPFVILLAAPTLAAAWRWGCPTRA